jgi:hypothetical protein
MLHVTSTNERDEVRIMSGLQTTNVAIPNPLYAKLDKFVRKTDMKKKAVVAKAVEEYLRRQEPTTVKEIPVREGGDRD